MGKLGLGLALIAFFPLIQLTAGPAVAWDDRTHLAIAKAAGYGRWYNATGADIAKIKAARIEDHNHYAANPFGTVVTPRIVLDQTRRYNQIDVRGHLYGAIVASLRSYQRRRGRGKYAEYHLAYAAHYIGDLSQPLHNISAPSFNHRHHREIDALLEDKILENLDGIEDYRIIIQSEEDLAREIARIANLSIQLGYRIDREDRSLTRKEAYVKLGHSVSLLKAVLKYLAVAGGQ